MKDTNQNRLSTAEIQKLKNRLQELEHILNTIQSGKVDALLIKNKQGELSVFTLEGSDEPYRILVESMSEGALSLRGDGKIMHCNKRFSQMVKKTVHEVVDSFIFEYIPKIEHDSLNNLLIQGQKRRFKKAFTLLGNNSIKAILLSCHNMKLGNVEGISIVVTDITQLKKTEEALQKLARFDPLTQLPNRYLFEDLLSKSLVKASRKKSILALFYIDIDNFKNVNDLFGHKAGDILLIEVSNRLKHHVKDEDFIAHLSGDEFAIILEDNNNITSISLAAEQLIEQFNQPFIIEKQEIVATLSIGISVYNQEKTTSAAIKQHADQALYQAKKSGRNCYRYYNKTMQQQLERYMLIVKHLRNAINENQFELYYQPKIDTRTNTMVGMEVLIRWNNQLIGNSSPAEFIIIAEETNLINQIGAWVINAALEQYKQWLTQIKTINNIKISINISANQLEDNSLIETITQVLTKTNVPINNILFELTETAVMKKTTYDKVELIKLLKKLGVGISIDDFGTGYSSFTYLTQLPIKELKIDKSFIDQIGRNKSSETIIIAIINLAKSLNLEVVAEGVETKEQLDFLTENECRIIQGYYFSKPLSVSEMAIYLKSLPQH